MPLTDKQVKNAKPGKRPPMRRKVRNDSEVTYGGVCRVLAAMRPLGIPKERCLGTDFGIARTILREWLHIETE